MNLAAVHRWGRARPTIADALLGSALVLVPGVILMVGRPEFDPGPGDLVAVAVAVILTTGRRRWPTTMLLLGAAVSAGSLIATGHRHPLVVVTSMVVAVTFVVRTDRRRAWLIGGVCVTVLFVVGGLFGSDGWWAQENLGAAAWGFAAVAVGDAIRSRRAYIAEVEARARRAEETREEEARRRVAEERLRIARELHDVVAHHIAVINVQAGAATHVLASRPEAVGPALAHIRRASDTVLKELASVVGVLRANDDPDQETAEPTRGLARLSELLDSLAAAGLRVEHQQRGTTRELPAVVDLAAYRIVQEALTNAHKYGNGRARLIVTYEADQIILDVTNPVAVHEPGSGSGYGLVGMRERASAAGGTVTAGPAVGGFAVHAELPIPQEAP